MAKKVSKYDLIDEMKSHLIQLIAQTDEYLKAYRYEAYDPVGAEIVYLRNHHDFTTGIHEGLISLHGMQRYKIKPQTKLRAGTKNYLKKYYENGGLRQIETFNDGEMDVCYQASYHGGKRYLFPFEENGKPYYTYTHVYHPQRDLSEEYMVHNGQIVYHRYRKIDECTFAYLYINYIPKGTYPISGCEQGIYRMADGVISYEREKEYTWYMEFDANRKGLPFQAPDMEYMKQDD